MSNYKIYFTLCVVILICICNSSLSFAQNDSIGESKVLDEVLVYGNNKDFGLMGSQMSATSMDITQVRSVCTALGEADILKALQKTPGVQQTTDGGSGILIRGGGYDNNLILIDGHTLYNAEHLGGFVSTINPDMLSNVSFYKGAFPARYGGRLSSVLDVVFRPGDMYRHHGLVNLGILGAHVQADGPIAKGRTSYNVGVRFSYMGLTVIPIYKLLCDSKDAVAPYSRMSYLDISTKFTHRFSGIDNLDFLFYFGKDNDNDSPTKNHTVSSIYDDNESQSNILNGTAKPIGQNEYASSYLTENRFNNMVVGATWMHRPSDGIAVAAGMNFSKYYNKLRYTTSLHTRTDMFPKEIGVPTYTRTITRNSYLQLNSCIEELSGNINISRSFAQAHNTRWGMSLSSQRLAPTSEFYNYESVNESVVTDQTFEAKTDSEMGDKSSIMTLGAYIEDDWDIIRCLRANIGLRYNIYVVSDRSYSELEPRISMRLLLGEKCAVKASYSVMTQAIHQLCSSSLSTPSDIWVPISEKITPMRSVQKAIGVAYTPSDIFDISLEGYYKNMDNLLDYNEGASFASTQTWSSLVSMGKGRAYGVELMMQKTIGTLNGWVSYTWSKTLRKFDRPGEVINSGKEYYDANDHRNHINIVVSYRFNPHWDISASWSYITGRRGNLPTTILHGGYPTEFNPLSGGGWWDHTKPFTGFGQGGYDNGSEGTYIQHFVQLTSYAERNGCKLPAVHHLDLSLNYRFSSKRKTQLLSFGIYNVYNRMNVSNVYIGYNDNDINSLKGIDRTANLKGICKFPLMPSISYQISF